MSNKRTLREELRLAGAKQSETSELIEVAGRLHQLPAADKIHTQTAAGRPWRRWRPAATLGLASIVGILVGAGVVAYAQTSLPGSWLYPSKRLSENVAVAVDPNYRATLMMRRSQEVKQLVDRRAGKPVVLATLADYRTEAAAYKSTNYAAFEYCKSNLEQAAHAAPSPERTAISDTLSSLQT
jgi:hypothetical protein